MTEYVPTTEPDSCIKLLDDWILKKKDELHKKYVLNSSGTEEGDVIYVEELKKIGTKLNSYIDHGKKESIKEFDVPEEVCKCILEVIGASVVFQDRITAWCIDFPAIRTKKHLKEEIELSEHEK